MSYLCGQPCRKPLTPRNECVRNSVQVFAPTICEKENLHSLHNKSQCRLTATTTVTAAAKRFEGEVNVAQIIDFELDRPETITDHERRSEIRCKVLQNHRKRIRAATIPVSHTKNEVVTKDQGEWPLWDDVNHQPSSLYINPRSLRLRPDRSFISFGHGPIWESSGVQPGQPGYGYSREGVPTGSDYILYMRGRKDSCTFNKDQSRGLEQNERASVVEELVRALWSKPEQVLERAARPQANKRKRKPFNVKDAKAHNKEREMEELCNVQNLNAEFEL